MKKVLLGFEHPALIKAITKYVRATKSDELEFQTATSRTSVLKEVETGEYDTLILMEKMGKESWSIDEIIQIKDSYPVNLIPIISEEYKGKQEMKMFCNYGITSAVFINAKGVYNVEEVSKLIYRPRILKDARVYYGITTIADIRGGGNVLDEVTYETVRNAILYGDNREPIGIRYVNAIGELTPSQVGDFLKRLDEPTLNELKKTVEFYDVLEALKKSKVIRSYHIPRGIRKLRNSKNQVSASGDEKEDIVYEKEVIDADENTVKFIEEEDEKKKAVKDVEYQDDDDNEEQLDGGDDDEFEIVFGEDNNSEDLDDDFSFADNLEQIKEEHKKEELKKEIREEKHMPGEYEKKEKTLKKRKIGELDDIPDKEEEEEDQKNKKTAAIVACICIVLVAFFFILIMLYINITIKRKAAAEAAATPSEYNTLYNKDEVAKYEVGETGNLILSDEDGNVLYNSSSDGTQAVEQEEEIDFDVVSELQGTDDTVNQSFNDTSGFEAEKEYKGLELVNLLNGNNGADCTLQMKNGTSVTIKRGNASIEEFKPSAMYKCTINGSELYFTEK